MDATHIHLLLNHFPILGSLFGFCLLAYGLLRKSEALEKAGLVTLVVIGLLGVPAYFTGEEAEETVEDLPGVSEHYLEAHEELAEVAFWLVEATTALALITLVLSATQGRNFRLLSALTALLAIGTFGTMVVVGLYGGKIRHSEVRGDAAEQPVIKAAQETATHTHHEAE